MPRVAIYMRVSKDDGSQTTSNQLPECRALAALRAGEEGREVEPFVYEEMASAAKRRPTFEAMMADAAAGRFDVLIVWAIDRFGRSMMGNLQDVTSLDKAGVAVVSVREPWLDTAGPTRGLLLAIFSWAAEQERARLIERTKAGINRARAAGKTIGRPKTRKVDIAAARALLDGGASVRACSRALGVPLATLQRALTS